MTMTTQVEAGTPPTETDEAPDNRRLLTRVMAYTTKDDREQLKVRGDEILVSVTTADTTGVVIVIYKRRYGREQGTRTIVLTPRAEGSFHSVIAHTFAPDAEARSVTGRGDSVYQSYHEVVPASALPKVVTALPKEYGPPKPQVPVPDTYKPAPSILKLPAEINGVQVNEPGHKLEPGWHLEFKVGVCRASVGPFDNLAHLDNWLAARAFISGRRSELRPDERIFMS